VNDIENGSFNVIIGGVSGFSFFKGNIFFVIININFDGIIGWRGGNNVGMFFGFKLKIFVVNFGEFIVLSDRFIGDGVINEVYIVNFV